MKYCARYSNKINLSIFDEVSIRYEGQKEDLIIFLQEHQNQKITLIIHNIAQFYIMKTWEVINTIHETYPDLEFKLCFKQAGNFELIDDALQECINNITVPYYMGSVAVNFDQLNYLCEHGVSEVYLAEDICFDLKRAKRVCERYGVKIRAFPNVAQSCIRTGPAHKKFFIRPEDIESYSDVIDTVEFWGELDRQEIFCRIYKNGRWFGELKEIITDLDIEFDSRCIVPIYAELRKSCGRKCMKGEKCTACDSILNISRKLGDMNLIIKQQKDN